MSGRLTPLSLSSKFEDCPVLFLYQRSFKFSVCLMMFMTLSLTVPSLACYLCWMSFLSFFTSNMNLGGMGNSSNIFLAFSTVPYQSPCRLEIQSQVLLTWLGSCRLLGVLPWKDSGWLAWDIGLTWMFTVFSHCMLCRAVDWRDVRICDYRNIPSSNNSKRRYLKQDWHHPVGFGNPEMAICTADL